MSDLLLNISLGQWHFQIGRNRPRIRVSRNPHTSRPWWRFTIH